MNKEQSNPFDDLQPFDKKGAQEYAEKQKALGERQAYLEHRVFVQNEDGVKLLELYKEQVLMIEVVAPGIDVGQMGVREGFNGFVRDIIRRTNQVEAGEK